MASKRRFIAAITVAFISFWSCTKDLGVIPEETVQPVEACDTITYSKHIAPLVENRCRSCHSPAFPSNPGGQDLADHGDLKTLVTSGKLRYVIFEATGSQRMPQGSELSAAEKSAIDCFIKNGAKQ